VDGIITDRPAELERWLDSDETAIALGWTARTQ
jgi:hypothetical protein